MWTVESNQETVSIFGCLFILEKLGKAISIRVKKWGSIEETVVFACGVMDQPEPLVEVICDRLASFYRQLAHLRPKSGIEGYTRNIESSIFIAL